MTAWFFERMHSFGDADAIVFDGRSHSQARLLELTEEWRTFLDEHDVRAGEVVALEGASSVEACAGLLALVDRGAMVVALTPPPSAKRDDGLVLFSSGTTGRRKATVLDFAKVLGTYGEARRPRRTLGFRVNGTDG